MHRYPADLLSSLLSSREAAGTGGMLLAHRMAHVQTAAHHIWCCGMYLALKSNTDGKARRESFHCASASGGSPFSSLCISYRHITFTLQPESQYLPLTTAYIPRNRGGGEKGRQDKSLSKGQSWALSISPCRAMNSWPCCWRKQRENPTSW